MSRIQLSVVVAVAPGHPALVATVRSLEAALTGVDAEIIVVGGEAPARAEHRLAMRHITASDGTLVPVAWGVGIAAAEGDLVACLSTEFTVHPEWATALIPMLREEVVGAAGAIALAPHSSQPSTAMYLLRFAPFLHPGRRRPLSA